MATGEGLQVSNSEKLRPSDRFEFAFYRIAYLQDCLACFEQTLPGISRNHWGAPPIQQLDIEFRFKFSDASRYGRLRNSRAVRAFREAACFDDRDEMYDLVDFHLRTLIAYLPGTKIFGPTRDQYLLWSVLNPLTIPLPRWS